MTDWRPIETAPKDVPILVFGGTWGCELGWTNAALKGPMVAQGGDGYFTIVGCCYYEAWVEGPTHWMPLPAPPDDVRAA